MTTPYVPPAARWRARLWGAAVLAGVGYGLVLSVIALRAAAGAELTGRFPAQPAAKAAMAVLLAAAACTHPWVRERRWLVAALGFSAVGDVLLAVPWWPPSFVGGLGAFLLAHLCFLAVLVPLAAPSPARWAGVGVLVLASAGLLVWFWPRLLTDGLAIPVTGYIGVLAAMVAAALLAGLPTVWTALGAVCFTVSDAMIGIDRFVLDSEALAVPIWWCYAAAQLLITAGLFFGRGPSGPAARPTR
ncbi:MAG TPA: lysoplasmalogenase [Mycolicibacillus parakoreensis]|uniref:Lysoplasmalogenase n=1 Tax=Mycolicibacillus parakoreensis TaxID=1069221 RepID=A0ABY3U0Y4_9MYCO|nr:lysoplasmalogenase [Mycolicibacillus parakoreensis]ULN51222.1 lysoplasmalogenase [Mycolicibacillus parakoreensis]HLR98902.1 lysoplasmalogenase [Mycolicibacillus parakoreensis]